MNAKPLDPFAANPFNKVQDPAPIDRDPMPAEFEEPAIPKAKPVPAKKKAKTKAVREKAKHSLSLSDHCWRQLRFNSFLEGRSASDIIEELVSNHLAEVRVTRKAG